MGKTRGMGGRGPCFPRRKLPRTTLLPPLSFLNKVSRPISFGTIHRVVETPGVKDPTGRVTTSYEYTYSSSRFSPFCRMKITIGNRVLFQPWYVRVPLNKPVQSRKRSDQDQTSLVSGIDIQEKLSSDVVTSTSQPQTTSSSSRLASQCGMKRTLASELVSLLPCSTSQIINQSDKSLKGSDQDQTTLVSGIDIQEKLSSDVVTSTSKPQMTSSSSSSRIAKYLRSSSKMRFVHKLKAFHNKKIKKKSS